MYLTVFLRLFFFFQYTNVVSSLPFENSSHLTVTKEIDQTGDNQIQIYISIHIEAKSLVINSFLIVHFDIHSFFIKQIILVLSSWFDFMGSTVLKPSIWYSLSDWSRTSVSVRNITSIFSSWSRCFISNSLLIVPLLIFQVETFRILSPTLGFGEIWRYLSHLC